MDHPPKKEIGRDKRTSPSTSQDARQLLGLELQYEHLKHLTTLSLTAVAGVVVLSNSLFAGLDNKTKLWAIAGLFLVGGVMAQLGAIALIDYLKSDEKDIDRKMHRISPRWRSWLMRSDGVPQIISISQMIAQTLLLLATGLLLGYAAQILEKSATDPSLVPRQSQSP